MNASSKKTHKANTAEDREFERVVQHFLNTPPKPHKPKGGKKKSGDSRRPPT